MTVRGETQKLEDSAVLKELCAAGHRVGRLPVSVEIHLELIIKEIAFPSGTLVKVKTSESGSPWRSFYIAKVYRTGRPVWLFTDSAWTKQKSTGEVIAATHIYGATEYMV